ncbi:MAG TPA: VPDSG-CTERM sorting domain-containing protein [Verrucomicrobiae bacterium]|nr:VPDSG-CTERM sorting domain-containing protein [Verrucomicrobiae bacterium]
MKYIKNLIFGTALLGITGVAQAVPTLYVSTTGAAGSYTILGSSPSGTVTSFSSIGVWNLIITTGLTYPAVGSAGNPTMTLSIQATSGEAGTLYIGFANNGYTGLGSINGSIGGHVVNGAAQTYAFTTFADTSNIQPVNTLPTGSTITTLSGSLPADANVIASGSLPLTAPYVLGELVQITAAGASENSILATLNFTPAGVPDGGMTVAMLGFGLVALVAANRKLGKA